MVLQGGTREDFPRKKLSGIERAQLIASFVTDSIA
jgi:hypothetical protein